MSEIEKRKLPTRRVKKAGRIALHWLEIGLGAVTLIGVILFTITQVFILGGMDWTQTSTFTLGLEIILEIVIGIEVVRMLLNYNLNTLIGLAIFIVIRKMLLIHGSFTDLFLGVVSLAILFAARYFFIKNNEKDLHK